MRDVGVTASGQVNRTVHSATPGPLSAPPQVLREASGSELLDSDATSWSTDQT